MGLCIQCDRCGKIIETDKVLRKPDITKVSLEPYMNIAFGTVTTTAYLCEQCSNYIIKELGGKK